MKKALLLLITLCMVTGIAVHADAAKHGQTKGKGMGMGMGKCMDRDMMGCCMGEGNPMMRKLMSLGLDDRQNESVRTIHMKMRKEEIRGKADIEVAEIELKEILMKDPVDLKAAEEKLKQIETMKTGLRYDHIKAHEEVKAVLTPEQREKLGPMMMEMGRGGMMGGCMCCGMDMMHGHDDMGMGRGMKHGCSKKGGMEKSGAATPPPAEKM